ncbi:MAG TPA: response regulator [Gaiellaceae bacterium]|nr:response regulator [Gaiellaceae bacterium]
MKRRPCNRATIRCQLAGLVLVVALPLLGALAYSTHTAHENAGEAAKLTSSQLAGLAASSVQEFITDARAEMAIVADRPLMRLMDPTRCDPFLREMLRLHRYGANATTVTLDGRGVCSALPVAPRGRASVADTEWFRRVRRTGRFTVGEPFVGRISHRRVAVLVIPVVERARRVGYMTMPIDLIRFQELFARLAQPSRSLVSVVTESGLIVARSKDAGRFVGTQLPPEVAARLGDPPSTALGVDGVERIFARSPVAGTPWIVVSGVPTSIAYGASNRLLKTVLILSLVLLGLSLLAAIAIGHLIARPVQALALRARDIAAGNSAAAVPLQGSREVVLAARQLDEMVAALRDTEQQFSQVLDATGIGAWTLELETGRNWRSHEHDRIFGYATPVADWSLETAIAHVVPEDRALMEEQFAHALETERVGFECRLVWPDASEHWIRVEGRLDRAEEGRPARVVGTIADISDRVRNDRQRTQLEEELRQSQKMEAVGQLAGGIAHDFNNLLTAISGYSELAISRLDGSDTELRGDIEEIARAGERAAQLTRQLLAFSRRQTLQTSVFDLNEAVSDSENLLRRLLGEHIEIVGSLAPYDCPVDADRGQVEQILMNLALNARDAMPDGGTLSIETETIHLDAGEALRTFDAPGGEYVLLRVSDTGCGMDADTQAQAFDPFFTTKAPGAGTGLGLATVFGSVRQNGGAISLTSEPGAGSAFAILLPLAKTPIPARAVLSTPTPSLGTERILLVEDEEVVRSLLRTILAGKGYDVLVASDGPEAVRLARTEPFDLLITDMVMPKMSGKELVDQLRRSRPGLRVVSMSGYAHEAAGSDGLNPRDGFIQKPFSAHDLGAIVRLTLDSVRALDDSRVQTPTPA